MTGCMDCDGFFSALQNSGSQSQPFRQSKFCKAKSIRLNPSNPRIRVQKNSLKKTTTSKKIKTILLHFTFGHAPFISRSSFRKQRNW